MIFYEKSNFLPGSLANFKVKLSYQGDMIEHTLTLDVDVDSLT